MCEVRLTLPVMTYCVCGVTDIEPVMTYCVYVV